MANWSDSSPDETTNYITVLTNLRDRDKDAAKAFAADPINPQENFFRYNRAGNKFQEYLTGTWTDKVLSIAGGGTGSTSASGIRTSLGLGTMSLQNDNAVNITGGTIGGSTAIPATNITSGVMAQARLGAGSGGAGSKFLSDNQTWQELPSGVAVGTILMYGSENGAPAGYHVCWGQEISRATFSALFAVIGTRYGVGDGSTTFNIPQMLGRIPCCHAYPGHPAGNLAGLIGGTWEHQHSISADGIHSHTDPAHSHTTDIHAHAAGGLSTAAHNHGGRTNTATLQTSTAQSGGGQLVTNDGVHDHVIQSSSPSVSGTTANAGGGATSVAGGGATTSDGSHSHSGLTGQTGMPPYLTLEFIIKY